MGSVFWSKYNGIDMQVEPITSIEYHNQGEGTSIEKSAKARRQGPPPSYNLTKISAAFVKLFHAI
jgi:hypothetical protein